jgi:hypothetical protein
VPLPDISIVPGESLTLEIELTDSADQVTLQLLDINTGSGVLHVAGSASAPVSVGGYFRVVANGVPNQGPLLALTVTPDEDTDSTAITFPPYSTAADIETGSVEINFSLNAFVATLASADLVPYVAGGWVAVSGNSSASANRAYRIWSVRGGPASDQVTVIVEQPIDATTNASTGELRVLSNRPVVVTGGAVIPATANPFSLEGHTITCELRDAASVDGTLLATGTAEKIEGVTAILELDVDSYYRGTPSGFTVLVESTTELQIGDVVQLEGADTTYIENDVPYTVTALTSAGLLTQVWLNGATSATLPLVESGGTMIRVEASASNRYVVTFTAEQTDALADHSVAFFDISHEFTAGSLPASPVRARVTCGGVALVASVAAGTDHLRIPSSPWRVRIVPAVTAPEA